MQERMTKETLIQINNEVNKSGAMQELKNQMKSKKFSISHSEVGSAE